jgi:hypothetical protein
MDNKKIASELLKIAKNLIAETVFVTRQEKDKALPISDSDIKKLHKIPAKWSISGVRYSPKNDNELNFLKKLFSIKD